MRALRTTTHVKLQLLTARRPRPRWTESRAYFTAGYEVRLTRRLSCATVTSAVGMRNKMVSHPPATGCEQSAEQATHVKLRCEPMCGSQCAVKVDKHLRSAVTNMKEEMRMGFIRIAPLFLELRDQLTDLRRLAPLRCFRSTAPPEYLAERDSARGMQRFRKKLWCANESAMVAHGWPGGLHETIRDFRSASPVVTLPRNESSGGATSLPARHTHLPRHDRHASLRADVAWNPVV